MVIPSNTNPPTSTPPTPVPPPSIYAANVELDAVLYNSEQDTTPRPWRGRLGDLLGNKHLVRDAKAGTPAFSPAIYTPGKARGNDGVSFISGLCLDYDVISPLDLNKITFQLSNIAFAMYTSYGDMVAGPDSRRVRVVIPLLRPVTKEEFQRVLQVTAAHIGVSHDTKCCDPARLWYLPACPQQRCDTAFIYYHTGSVLDPASLLNSISAPEAMPSTANSGPPLKEAAAVTSLRRRLERLKDSPSQALIEPVLAGQPFAEKGERDDALWRIMRLAAFMAPHSEAGTLVRLVEPSLVAMANLEPEDHLTLEVASEKAERALKEARNSESVVFQRGDQVELAQAVIKDLAAGADFLFADGGFYRYSAASGTYELVPMESLSRHVQGYAGRLVVGFQSSGELRVSSGTVEGTLRLAVARASQSGFFDEAPVGVAFGNGFVSVTAAGIHLGPHSPANRARTSFGWDFDVMAPCPRFMQFLAEIFRDDSDAEDKIAALQEFIGASLLGIAPRYAKALVLVGTGRNGKSVFIDIVLSLFEESARAAVPPQNFEADYHRELLAGKLINSVAELPRADIMKGESFKAIIAGDVVTARQIFQKPITFRPRAAHIMAANALPGSDDLTPAFFERVLIVKFGRFFAPEERDTGLTAQIVQTERAGVAAWALRGAARLLAKGAQGSYVVPASHTAVLNEWKLRADQIRQYLNDRTRPAATRPQWVQAKTLYTEYKRWAQENGHKMLSNSKFGERLEALGIRKIKPGSVNLYELELLPDTAPSGISGPPGFLTYPAAVPSKPTQQPANPFAATRPGPNPDAPSVVVPMATTPDPLPSAAQPSPHTLPTAPPPGGITAPAPSLPAVPFKGSGAGAGSLYQPPLPFPPNVAPADGSGTSEGHAVPTPPQPFNPGVPNVVAVAPPSPPVGSHSLSLPPLLATSSATPDASNGSKMATLPAPFKVAGSADIPAIAPFPQVVADPATTKKPRKR